MGYDVHIVAEDEIPLETWQAFVERDPDLRLDGFAEATSPGGDVIRIESPGLAVWTAHEAVFDWRGGRIVVTNPDETIVAKMRAIARALDARVQGDEGEFYDD
jgi:hypothetical protein